MLVQKLLDNTVDGCVGICLRKACSMFVQLRTCVLFVYILFMIPLSFD